MKSKLKWQLIALTFVSLFFMACGESSDVKKPFVFVIETTADSQSITINTPSKSAYLYDVSIDQYQPGAHLSKHTNQSGNFTHTFVSAGTYTISITGSYPRLKLTNARVTEVTQWGDNAWESMLHMFQNAKGLSSFPTSSDTPDLSKTSSLEGMFLGASKFNGDISQWNVSKVTDMSWMFGDAKVFNEDISKWDVSKVTDMSHMFNGAEAFNGDISNWDVSSVTAMSHMFQASTDDHPLKNMLRATAFNGDISKWDVSKVTDMSRMFNGASAFNGDISNWDVSSVTTMSRMFNSALAFNGDISQWNVSSVTDMSYMFAGAINYNIILPWKKKYFRFKAPVSTGIFLTTVCGVSDFNNGCWESFNVPA